jgi:tetratricopeptide (TPR) repeat protein
MIPSILILLLIALHPEPANEPPDTAGRALRAANDLYRQGELGEALVKFEEAIDAGAQGGELFYRAGYCYKNVKGDSQAGEKYMRKALALLEKRAESPEADPATFYYISAIYTSELADIAQGKAAAQRGVVLAEKAGSKSVNDGESLFQIASLYSLAGLPDKAIGWYERAAQALGAEEPVNRPYLIVVLDQLARFYTAKQDFAQAGVWLGRQLDVEPEREQVRLQAGLMMVRAGQDDAAIEMLAGAFQTLREAIGSAAQKLGKIRGEEPNPPASPERIAAEREFFGLLMEHIRRGYLVRELALRAGFAALIFR